MITIAYLEKFAGTPVFNRAVMKLIDEVQAYSYCEARTTRGWAELAEKLGMYDHCDLLYAAAGLEEWNDDNI